MEPQPEGTCETQQIEPSHHVWMSGRRATERDIHGNVFEPASSEFRRRVVAHSGAFKRRVEPARPPDVEREVVAELNRLGNNEVGIRCFFIVLPPEIDILRGAEPGSDAIVESDRSLEDEAIRRDGH